MCGVSKCCIIIISIMTVHLDYEPVDISRIMHARWLNAPKEERPDKFPLADEKEWTKFKGQAEKQLSKEPPMAEAVAAGFDFSIGVPLSPMIDIMTRDPLGYIQLESIDNVEAAIKRAKAEVGARALDNLSFLIH
jgi:hypothetical protein